MSKSESATDTADVLRRLDETIRRLDEMRTELRVIRQWAEMMQKTSTEATDVG